MSSDERLEIRKEHVHDSRRVGYGDLLWERDVHDAGLDDVVVDTGQIVGMADEGHGEERIDLLIGDEVGIVDGGGSGNRIICQAVALVCESAGNGLRLCSLLDDGGRSRCLGDRSGSRNDDRGYRIDGLAALAADEKQS